MTKTLPHVVNWKGIQVEGHELAYVVSLAFWRYDGNDSHKAMKLNSCQVLRKENGILQPNELITSSEHGVKPRVPQ